MIILEIISILSQFVAILFSFTTAVMTFFTYLRFKKKIYKHILFVFIAFFVISANTLYSYLAFSFKSPVEYNKLVNFILFAGIGFFFNFGLVHLSFDFPKFPIKSRIRIIPNLYFTASFLVYLFFLTSEIGDYILMGNILGIWLPSAISLLITLLYRKKISAGIFSAEKKLIISFSLLNLIIFLFSFVFREFRIIFPFITIISICFVTLSVTFKHYFLASGLLDNQLSKEIIKRYSFSPREVEVVNAVLEGKTNKELSELFYVTQKTIETHLTNIYKKSGVKNRLELYSLFNK